MKLIIDIPETVYNMATKYNAEFISSIYIKNGIPIEDKEKSNDTISKH